MTSADEPRVIFMNGVAEPVDPAGNGAWTGQAALIRADYERCRPDDTLDALAYRARFSKEDKALLHSWMEVAARRAAAPGVSRTPVAYGR